MTESSELTHAEIVEELSRGIDRYDVELRSCYHPDAVDIHDIYNGGLEGFIELAHQFRNPNSDFGIMRHILTNSLIERTGDVAHVESYLYNPLVPRDPLGDSASPAGVRLFQDGSAHHEIVECLAGRETAAGSAEPGRSFVRSGAGLGHRFIGVRRRR
ncbi:nuclear transport factor 2 family protein [Amycolatopsis thermalba]|uniref:Nuclear transport factor 2 family protein n=1 Tax=Amycolatopsis thermalba TaxID=944492 RepID=A0ABY4P585_9PSEU|nr:MULTISPECIES: nuclear transport factor 2 family protein [Amycolatopsis]UQS27484.1 nuclear transport factor 2 family protein [Amycolatopsis thermalba]